MSLGSIIYNHIAGVAILFPFIVSEIYANDRGTRGCTRSEPRSSYLQ
jgi:hypothetical protein